MSDTKLPLARDLIEQKRYAEARALLLTINHPTATKWLAKLDDMDKADEARLSPPPALSRGGVSWLSVVSTLLVIVLAVVIVSQQFRLDQLSRIVGVLETDISSVRTASASANSAGTLSSRVQTLEGSVSELVSVVNSHASDIRSLSYDLSSVSAIANNANRYAHSHSYSDAALKVDVTSIDKPLERLLSLNGVSFTWNSAAYPDLPLETGRDYGVLAQQLAPIFPELVTSDPNSGFLRVDYEGLIPVLIEAIREQQQQIDHLQTLVTAPK